MKYHIFNFKQCLIKDLNKKELKEFMRTNKVIYKNEKFESTMFLSLTVVQTETKFEEILCFENSKVDMDKLGVIDGNLKKLRNIINSIKFIKKHGKIIYPIDISLRFLYLRQRLPLWIMLMKECALTNVRIIYKFLKFIRKISCVYAYFINFL